MGASTMRGANLPGRQARLRFNAVHAVAAALALALVTLFYPTHFFVPGYREGPAPGGWQAVAGWAVKIAALPIAVVNRLGLPRIEGLDLWFPQAFGPEWTRGRLIASHLAAGVVAYLGPYGVFRLVAALRRRGRRTPRA